jgi:hypothetical protein
MQNHNQKFFHRKSIFIECTVWFVAVELEKAEHGTVVWIS